MKYLNLSKGFNPYNIHPEGINLIKFESFFFNGGEPHIKLDFSQFKGEQFDVTVTSRLTSMNDFMMLAVATEALCQSGHLGKKCLFIPYFPGARQDRRMVIGEPLTVKIFSDILNNLNYDLVKTFDNHSDVSTALIDNCTNLDNHEFVNHIIFNYLETDYIPHMSGNFALISPDAGANKKINKLAKDLNRDIIEYCKNNKLPVKIPFPIVKCDKTRDVSNGNIIGFEVYTDDLKGKDCIIVDDICDGGGTFIRLAKELKKKNAGNLYLIVSHGIFSKDVFELNKYYKEIYTTDSWRSGIVPYNIIKFKDFM